MLALLALVAIVVIGVYTISSGKRAAEAAAQSATASTRAVKLSEQDAGVRRLEAALETVLEMRELFHEQRAAGAENPTSESEGYRKRLALNGRLDSRRVALTALESGLPALFALPLPVDWTASAFQQAIMEVQGAIRETVAG